MMLLAASAPGGAEAHALPAPQPAQEPMALHGAGAGGEPSASVQSVPTVGIQAVVDRWRDAEEHDLFKALGPGTRSEKTKAALCALKAFLLTVSGPKSFVSMTLLFDEMKKMAKKKGTGRSKSGSAKRARGAGNNLATKYVRTVKAHILVMGAERDIELLRKAKQRGSFSLTAFDSSVDAAWTKFTGELVPEELLSHARTVLRQRSSVYDDVEYDIDDNAAEAGILPGDGGAEVEHRLVFFIFQHLLKGFKTRIFDVQEPGLMADYCVLNNGVPLGSAIYKDVSNLTALAQLVSGMFLANQSNADGMGATTLSADARKRARNWASSTLSNYKRSKLCLVHEILRHVVEQLRSPHAGIVATLLVPEEASFPSPHVGDVTFPAPAR